MVLGYDDSYMNEEVVSELTPFEKYYQRIVKGTDNSYIQWIKDMNYEKNNVYVFGHSLSPSDGDVLRQFFEANETHTTIYYIDEEDKAKKISNLALILGREKLIELAGGISPRITFEII